MVFNVYSPLEQFEVISFISINIGLFNYINFSLTNLGFYTIMTVFLVCSVHIYNTNNFILVPNRYSIALESSFASVLNLCKSQIGQNKEIYFPAIYALFFFILFQNLLGNIPYGFTVATSIIVSIGLSVTVFIAVTILGLVKHKLHFFSFFVPTGTPLGLVPLLVPIELISYLARAFSLGVRLFANVTAGHVLIKILAGFLAPMFISNIITSILTIIPFIIFTGIIGLEIAVSFIQAYVFCVLTCSYIKDAIDLH